MASCSPDTVHPEAGKRALESSAGQGNTRSLNKSELFIPNLPFEFSKSFMGMFLYVLAKDTQDPEYKVSSLATEELLNST